VRVRSIALLVAALLAPAAALAQPTPAAVAARALLIEQAERAAAAGDHRGALDLAERAGRVEITPSLRMFVAQEQLATGAFAAAMSSAILCARDAARDPQLPYRDNVLTRCRDVAQRARASVALVTLRSPPAGEGLRVTLDDRPVTAELLDVPLPLDPGAHAVTVGAAGRGLWERRFEARSGEATELTLSLGEPEAPPAPPPPPPPPPAPRPLVVRRGPPAGAIALLAAGGGALLASGVFFALRAASASGCAEGADPAMPSERVWLCDTPAQAEAVMSHRTWTALAGVTLGVGALSAGAGALWWALGGRGTRPSVAPVAGGLLLSWEGTF
jgi:hypothetical protein